MKKEISLTSDPDNLPAAFLPRISGNVPVNGIQLYHEIYGEGGTPLVLIHGGGSTIETTFGRVLPLLSGYGQIIALELQAHGRTGDRDAPESFQQDADDVAGLLKHLNVSKADIFGFSNGATTALQFAIRHPETARKIVALAGCWRRDGLIPGFFDGFAGATLEHSMPESLKAAYLKVNPDPKGLQNMFDKDMNRMKNFRDMPDKDLQSIKAPTLLMVSDRDVITIEHTLWMSRQIPGSRLIVLPGTHGVCLGTAESSSKPDSRLPAITIALVQEFLNEE